MDLLPRELVPVILCKLPESWRAWVRRVCRAWAAAVGERKLVVKTIFVSVNLADWAHSSGCPWTWRTCALAAGGGHVEALRYAHENGCPWDSDTCASAAKGGHVEALRYAHENGCPWGSDTCESAAKGGHVEALRYAHENGCPKEPN
jgi:hypothetical protein